MSEKKGMNMLSKQTARQPKRIPSMESTASAIPKQPEKTIQHPEQRQTLSNELLYDYITIFCFCLEHKTVHLEKINRSKGLYYPYLMVKPFDSMKEAIIKKIKSILSVPGTTAIVSCTVPELYLVKRIQFPFSSRFLTRLSFVVEIVGGSKCCIDTKQGNWYSFDSIKDNLDLWGQEIRNDLKLFSSFDTVSMEEIYVRDNQKFWPRTISKYTHDDMLKSSGLTEKSCYKILIDYYKHAMPSMIWDSTLFTEYLTRIEYKCKQSEIKRLFRAFCGDANEMTFNDLIVGLAAYDTNTKHSGLISTLRVGYIFRYYDSENKKYLDVNDVTKMIDDINKSKIKKEDTIEVDKFYQILGYKTGQIVTEDMLSQAVSTKTLRGTASLFRSSVSITHLAIDAKLEDTHLTEDSEKAGTEYRVVTKGTCLRCRLKQYTLALHLVKLKKDAVIEIIQLKEDDCNKMRESKKQLSLITFNPDNRNNSIIVIEMIKEYYLAPTKETTGWVSMNRKQLIKLILNIFKNCEDIFRKEARCVKVNSPCFVFGDLHGNLHDLMVYNKMFWSRGPGSLDANYLFLGDYVDRGEHSVECVLFLYALKSLEPEKIFLLRGNHELRAVQKAFTFVRECFNKFGKADGPFIWEVFNRVFDCMPICAVVDESIYCAHGGIPAALPKIEEINAIPCPLADPENESTGSWEILWNDPIDGDKLKEKLRDTPEIAQSMSKGFMPNTKRGTALYFSEEALTNFLVTNSLTHVIRAHECIPEGYLFMMAGKMLTIFSSSRYCKGTNEAACVFIEIDKIRVIQLKTWKE